MEAAADGAGQAHRGQNGEGRQAPKDMNAQRYATELNLEDVHVEAVNLAEVLFMVLHAGAAESIAFDEGRCEAASQLAWRLALLTKRLRSEYEKAD